MIQYRQLRKWSNPRKEMEMVAVKNNRTSHQTARQGWKPRKTSDARLVKNIVASIRAHAEAGVNRTAADYSSRVEIIEAVEELLSR
jgi:hypothetical protein